MRIARPRLLAGSLAVAAVVGIVGGLVWAQQSDDDAVEATLSDPQGVVTYPADGLGNDDVAGDQMPIVDLADADGNDVSTGEFLGDPLVVNFWFSTCPPCAKELPDFAEVHAEVGDEVRFVGVNTIDSVEVMERFAGDRGVRYELYRDDYAEFTDGIGASAFPVTIFVTSEGVIVGQTGALDADELREQVDQLLAKESA
ncbi:MAG: redoxin family protein [Acidimicrobiia bacterium]|nr:redoxin family protein [Acidimicrobiia bacterium]